jgi:hypothetical protein
MTEEKQEKTRKPPIGGIGHQYATLGGGRKTATPDVQTPEPLSVQDAGHSDIQTSSTSSVQEPKHSRWKRRTIYLYPDVDRAVRHHIADTDEEISEVVNAALRQFFGLPAK